MSSTEENPSLINDLITRESVNNLGPEDDPGPALRTVQENPIQNPETSEGPSERRSEARSQARSEGGSEGGSTGGEAQQKATGDHSRLNMSQIDQLKSENLNLKRVLDEKETLISVLTSNLHSVIEERNNLKILALKNANDDIITPAGGIGHLLSQKSNDSGGYVGLSSLIGSMGPTNPVGSMMGTSDRTMSHDGRSNGGSEVSVKQEINGQDEMTIEEVDSSSMTSPTSAVNHDVIGGHNSIGPNVLNRSNFGISLGNQKIDLGEFLNSIKEIGQGQTTGLDQFFQSVNQKGTKKRRKEVDEEMASIAKKASLEDIKVGFKLSHLKIS